MLKIITKRITVFVMAACLVVGFAGCGDKDKPKTEEPVVSEEET